MQGQRSSSAATFFPFGEYIPANATFGNRHQVTGGAYNATSPVNQQFTGQERDAESDLDNFGARYFLASLGRFTSPDNPFADQFASEPQSWNLYAYVSNGPLNHTDPTGRCKEGKDGKFRDSEEGPCVEPESATVTVSEEAPKERDVVAEMTADFIGLQLDARRRSQDLAEAKKKDKL